MKEFKYSLAKRGKIICANCGKKTAVPYIETETGNIVEGAMRCDREQSCAYHRKPESNDVIFIPKSEVKVKETSYISLDVLERYFLNKSTDNLITFLTNRFGHEKVRAAVDMYFISDTGNGNTIFWQIDQLERVRSGKIMEYNKITGKRVKDANGKAHINWMHSYLKIEDYNLRQCLFGLHLTKEIRNKTIAIVESEKTAVIMSICEPNFLWLATGAFNGFKIEYLSPIKLRKIIAFPDKGCYNDFHDAAGNLVLGWKNRAENLNQLGFEITVNDFLENEQCEPGEDIADNYLKI